MKRGTDSRGRGGSHQFTLRDSFAAAFRGFAETLECERNMKLHVFAAILVSIFEIIVRPPLGMVAVTWIAITSVMSAELFNTALERIVDELANGRTMDWARLTKDAAAAAVLGLACAAAVYAAYLVIAMYPWPLRPFSAVSLPGAVINLVGLLVLCSLVVRMLWNGWR